jgi:toxin ParE1/3/4
MSYDYFLSKKANDDIENIWLYTRKNWSREQADRYFNLILDEIEYIASDLESGKDYGHIKSGYRGAKVKSHIIFYRMDNSDSIEIVRILHQMMDIKNKLK